MCAEGPPFIVGASMAQTGRLPPDAIGIRSRTASVAVIGCTLPCRAVQTQRTTMTASEVLQPLAPSTEAGRRDRAWQSREYPLAILHAGPARLAQKR